MFLLLLLITFIIAFTVSLVVARAFTKPLDSILRRIVTEEIGRAWLKYLKFAILVVGISAGVRIHELEKYITPFRGGPYQGGETGPVVLTTERWVLEVYRTIIETLQGIAWLLLVFFVFSLIAYVIVRIAEPKRGTPGQAPAKEEPQSQKSV